MTAATPKKRLPASAYAELERAFSIIEENTFAARLARISFGLPGKTATPLPAGLLRMIEKVVEPALKGALTVAIRTLGEKGRKPAEGAVARHIHKVMASLSGAAGGAAGLPGLLAELPVTTLLMLRRIAEIARRNGEDLSDPDTRLACLEVFALSGLGTASEAAGTTYYAFRIALHGALTQAKREIAGKGALFAGRAFSGVLSKIAARFGSDIARVAGARLIPVAGAAGGALLNALFMEHYQELAEAHFTIRRLERTYGRETVRRAYEQRSRIKRKRR